jgi:phosphatidylserine/phosphatidylglycerophosphate/cardiolipin synthase-like enzyme
VAEGYATAERLLLWAADNSEWETGSLHAKCIVVDGKHVFISSANFTEAAQERNIEVGLLVQSRAVAERVCRFFDALLDSGYFVRTI